MMKKLVKKIKQTVARRNYLKNGKDANLKHIIRYYNKLNSAKIRACLVF